MKNWWLENAGEVAGKPGATPPHLLLDLGYVNAKKSRDRADKVMKIVSRKNLQIAGFGRILIRIPPTLLDKVLTKFPEIKKGDCYCWCTHSWLDKETTDLKYATK